MTIIWIPNVSEGRNPATIEALVDAAASDGVRVLDVHSDARHNRTVITATGAAPALIEAAAALAQVAASSIVLAEQTGEHPRLGALDVSPFVPHETSMDDAVATARAAAVAINERTDLPIYLYGYAASRPGARGLPDLRRGGLQALIDRARRDLPPDIGDVAISPSRGVVCVGARGPLIAFNVWLDAPVEIATAIARSIRGSALRALGMDMGDGTSQVSMNLIDPEQVGIEAAFEKVEDEARAQDSAAVATEIVGLPPERFLPSPDAKAARLLREPGRSLESELARS